MAKATPADSENAQNLVSLSTLRLTGLILGSAHCQILPDYVLTVKSPYDRISTCMQAFAGIVTVSVGHCHPKVLAAVNEQNKRLQHTTTIYLHNEIAEYAKELADKMPGNLKVCLNHNRCLRTQ